MKIINNDFDESYQLDPDTELEIERTNPFFNEYGEQSLPVNLPCSEQNRKLTSYPDLMSAKSKASAKINATITDGEYVMQCRQAVLGAQKKGYINTSFYMNDGSFNSKISNVDVRTIFGSETVSGITTIEQGIAFCRDLLSGSDERFAIFPVIANSDDGYKYINRLAWMNTDGSLPGIAKIISFYTSAPDFYNAFSRTETINEKSVLIPAGYYLSPFIKAGYLLKRVLSYFGYTLLENLFDSIEPFSSMVFLNNTFDTLAKGIVKYSDIVPACSVSDLLSVYRYKFHCEFIPDEINKTISIVLFNNVISEPAQLDLTDKLISEPIIEFPESYRQIKLSSQNSVSEISNSFNSYQALKKAYPTALLNKSDMCFYRTGYKLGVANTEKVCGSNLPYADTENLELEEIIVPDCQPTMMPSIDRATSYPVDTRTAYTYVPLINVGDGNYLNSTVKFNVSEDDEDSSSSSKDTNALLPMLAFHYDATGYKYIHGTISNYDYLGTTRLWNYSLCYYGPDGLYERFWRSYDDCLRNSFHQVKADLLLTRLQKLSIPAHKKIIINGQELLIDKLKYKIGEKDSYQESEFKTVRLYAPINQAQSESDKLSVAFKWELVKVVTEITLAEYTNSPYKDAKYSFYYPPHPDYLGQTGYDQYQAKAVTSVYPNKYLLFHSYLRAIANT